MRTWGMLVVVALLLSLSTPSARAADDSRVTDATRQVESGAKAAGHGIAETAKGVGNTVVEGAKLTGEKFKEAGHAAEPQAKNAWQRVKDGASDFGHGVKNFFARLTGS